MSNYTHVFLPSKLQFKSADHHTKGEMERAKRFDTSHSSKGTFQAFLCGGSREKALQKFSAHMQEYLTRSGFKTVHSCDFELGYRHEMIEEGGFFWCSDSIGSYDMLPEVDEATLQATN